jgi:hypothetical protein
MMRRVGELLKEIEAGKAGRPPSEEIRAGARPNLTRTQAAADAGLSERKRKTALRVASVPKGEFEAAIQIGRLFRFCRQSPLISWCYPN